MQGEVQFKNHRPRNRNYHRAVKGAGQIGRMTDRLDTQVRKLHDKYTMTPLSESNVHEQLQPYIDAGHDVLQNVDNEQQSGWLHYYRLMGRLAFVSELVIAPHLYATDNFAARAELANGTSGKAIEIIDDILQRMDQRAEDVYLGDDGDLRGAINEYTPIALTNRPQDGMSLALPSSFYGDIVRKSDHIYYGSEGNDCHFRTNIQVKGTYKPGHAHKYRQHVIVYAKHFKNSGAHGTFPISRLLVKENNGEILSDKELDFINCARASLERQILRRRNCRNTIYRSLPSEPSQLTHGLQAL